MDYRSVLRQLAIGDGSLFEDVVQARTGTSWGLDPRAAAIACLAASVAMGTSASGYQSHVDSAFAAGATVDEIIGVLIAVGPTVGMARVMLAATPLGLAAGYDTEAALERLDPD